VTDVWFLRQALADLRDAREWYERQRYGLGDEFATAVGVAVDAVADYPVACPIVHRGTRRVLIEGFPYGLYYRAYGGAVIFVALLHVACDPVRHRFRLSE
jgi:plasmid stabilization system protein ParE